MYAQLSTGPEIAWQRCYGTSGGDNFLDAIITNDDGIIASIYYGGYDGDAEGLSSLSHPAGLMKFDTNINLIWQKYFGGSDNISYFKKVIEITSGFAAVGNTSAFDGDFPDNHGNLDFMMVKVDSVGNKIWSKCYGGPGIDETEGFLNTLDGGFLLTGRSSAAGGDIPFHYPGGAGDDDAIVIKTDSLGEIIWVKVLGGTGDDGPLGDIVENERGYYIINIGAHSNDYDLAESGISGDKRWIVKLDSLGNIVDESFMSGATDLYTYTGPTVMPYKDGFLIVGQGDPDSELYTTSPEHASDEGAVAIFNGGLDLIFFKQWGGSGFEGFAKAIRDQNNGNFYYLGASQSVDYDLPGNYNNGEELDYWLFATDSNFNTLWSRNFGGSYPQGDLGFGSFSGNIVLQDNMIYAFVKNTIPDSFPDFDIECGMEGSFDYYTDAWLVAFDLSTVNIDTPIVENNFSIYPNPAENTIYVLNNTPDSNAYTFGIYNTLGQKVLETALINNEENIINIQSLPSGLYVAAIINGGIIIQSEKIILQ